jgi:hypothetical protein
MEIVVESCAWCASGNVEKIQDMLKILCNKEEEIEVNDRVVSYLNHFQPCH